MADGLDAPAGMNEPAAPGQTPSDVQPGEMAPPSRTPEGQPGRAASAGRVTTQNRV
jgi:hypothetical protein